MEKHTNSFFQSGEKTGNYELGADITLTSVWKTAGEFKGTLDGKNHTVYNMEISSDVFQPDGTSVNYMAAMFSENKGVIKNINFENFSVNILQNSRGCIIVYSENTARFCKDSMERSPAPGRSKWEKMSLR